MSVTSRVLVIQQPMGPGGPAFDFGPAAKFGHVEILLPNGKDILTPDVFLTQIEDSLHDFNPEDDYIITTGDYSVLLFVGMFIARKFGRVQILRWVSGAKAYQPLTLDIRTITQSWEELYA